MALSPQEATQSCLIYFTLGPSLLKYLHYKTTKIAVANITNYQTFKTPSGWTRAGNVAGGGHISALSGKVRRVVFR